MIEKIIIDSLIAQNLRAYAEQPPTPPTLPYYIVEKTGGGETETISRALVTIQSYGSSLYNAANANETLITAMRSLVEDGTVCSCELNSDYNFTDRSKKEYRYQAVFEIHYYR